jgi:hypothetical protein
MTATLVLAQVDPRVQADMKRRLKARATDAEQTKSDIA